MKENLYKLLNPFSPILGRMTVPLFALRYYKKFHRPLQLSNPTLFYDKTFWLARNTDVDSWAYMADKYLVRYYVAKKCGEQILTKLYAVYDSAQEIRFEQLPAQFVMKTTNGCASNVIVRDKSAINVEEIREKMDFWMGIHYGELTGQPQYAKLTPRIIAEQLLIQDGDPNKTLTDYKFNCFDGFVHSCAAFRDRVQGTHQFARMIYDMDWNPHPEWIDTEKVHLGGTPKPPCFEQMKKIAEQLSEGLPFVRVDLYCIDGKPYFGEMTFTPGLAYYTTEFQKLLGDQIILPKESGK